MHLYTCTGREQYQELLHGSLFAARMRFLRFLAEKHQEIPSFLLPGICEVCDAPADFLTDYLYGVRIINGVRWPNWRERQVCLNCDLSSRQRLALGFVRQTVAQAGNSPEYTVYMMEQITPVFRVGRRVLQGINLIGSEYVEPGFQDRSVRERIRHEDVQNLSFNDESIDLILSNDVMEHVPDPDRGFRELCRVLRRGGKLFLTIPFNLDEDASVTRAELRDGGVHHHRPEVYHGNPLAEKGSLVFTDFGWDLLARLRAAGFATVEMKVAWSYTYGHLGIPMEYFIAGR